MSRKDFVSLDDIQSKLAIVSVWKNKPRHRVFYKKYLKWILFNLHSLNIYIRPEIYINVVIYKTSLEFIDGYNLEKIYIINNDKIKLSALEKLIHIHIYTLS